MNGYSEIKFLFRLQFLLSKKNPVIVLLAIFLLVIISLVSASGVILHSAIIDSFERSGNPNTIIVSSASANSETESFIVQADINKLKADLSSAGTLEHLQFEPQVLLSSSLDIEDGVIYLGLRGIEADSSSYKNDVVITDGKMFRPGRNEVIVGESIANKYPEFSVGNTVKLAKKDWEITGTFSMNGDIRENEFVGDLVQIQFRYDSNDVVSTIRLRGNNVNLSRAMEVINNKDSNLSAENEKAFFIKQSQSIASIIIKLQIIISILIIPAALTGLISIQKIHIRSLISELKLLYWIGFLTKRIKLSMFLQTIVIAFLSALIACLPIALYVKGKSIEIDLGLQTTYIQFSPDHYSFLILFGISIGLSVISQIFTPMNQLLTRDK